MAEKLPATAGPALPDDLVGGLVGAEAEEQFRFTEEILAALQKISPSLVPRLSAHPLADAIGRGVGAFPDLLQDFKTTTDEHERAAIVDAIGEIISREYATAEVMAALGKIMSSTKSSAIASIASRAIAAGGDQGFLEQQRNFLGSDNLTDVRLAAKLLGHGKYEPAVDVLLLLLRPDNMAVADAVMWALGEIGSPKALPKLHGMLSDLIFVEPTIEAVGKIGDTTSVIRLLPLLIEGGEGQREKAAQAILRIARKNDGWLGDEALSNDTKAALLRAADTDKSPLVRFYSIVAFSVLGEHIGPAQIKKALGAKLTKKEMDALGGFFSERKPDGDGPKGKKKVRRKPV